MRLGLEDVACGVTGETHCTWKAFTRALPHVSRRRRYGNGPQLAVGALALLGLMALGPGGGPGAAPPACTKNTVVDFADPIYQTAGRHLVNPAGHEHNLYYHRNPFNADNTYMAGIRSDLNSQNWVASLYTGDGCFIKDLFSPSAGPMKIFDWRLAWDHSLPNILYTYQGTSMGGDALYKIDVSTTPITATLLKDFTPLRIAPAGVSLSQPSQPGQRGAGEQRILVVTQDPVTDVYRIQSYRLPKMDVERVFQPAFPSGCNAGWTDVRYIGYENYVATFCESADSTQRHIYVYTDTGVLYHDVDQTVIRQTGHQDFGPTGKLAYFHMQGGGLPLQIGVVNLDGTGNQVLYSVPQSQAQYVRNMHCSWPDKVQTWFLCSLFPDSSYLPPTYAPPLDEILKCDVVLGACRYLARTGTTADNSNFWRQPLVSPSADGSRAAFNSVSPGTVDQYILYIGSSH